MRKKPPYVRPKGLNLRAMAADTVSVVAEFSLSVLETVRIARNGHVKAIELKREENDK